MVRYSERLCSPEEAVAKVKSGDRIVFSHACGEPRTLPGALVKRAGELPGVEIIHMVPMGEAIYCRPEYAGSFRHVAIFAGAPTREAIWESRADYIPLLFSEVPSLFDSLLPLDVAMVTVSPPDANGLCSLGVSVDYTKHATECAKTVIAEVNPTMPRTHGESFIHVSDIDFFVEVDAPIYELKGAPTSEVEERIGRHTGRAPWRTDVVSSSGSAVFRMGSSKTSPGSKTSGSIRR